MHAPLRLVPALVLFAGCEATPAPSVSFGETLKYESGREPIDARVEAEGTYFTTPLHIADHKGERMEVRVYGDNGKLLGFETAVPTYDATVWEKFRVFVPRDALAGMRPDRGFDIYVVAPDDPDHYVVHDRYDKSNLSAPDIVWHWVEYRDRAELAGGRRGMAITLSLDIDGHQGETLQTYAVVRDMALKEIGGDEGGPIRIAGPTIAPPYASTNYAKLVFEIPYDRLAALPPNRRLKITPSVLVGDTIVAGNLNFITWAGGGAADVRDKIAAMASDYAGEAETLQREIDRLAREGGQ